MEFRAAHGGDYRRCSGKGLASRAPWPATQARHGEKPVKPDSRLRLWQRTAWMAAGGPVRRCVPGLVRHTGYAHSRHLTRSGRAVPARERQHGFGTKDRARSLPEAAAREATPAINRFREGKNSEARAACAHASAPIPQIVRRTMPTATQSADTVWLRRLRLGVRDEPALKMHRASQSANHPGTQASVNETTGSRSSALACPIATRSRRAL